MKSNKPARAWRKTSWRLAPLLVGIVGCIACCQWVVIGCLWRECANNQPFNSLEAEIPKDLFPTGSTYGHLGSDSQLESARQRESQTIFWGDSSSAVFTIARYPGPLSAAMNFAQEIRVFKLTADTPWPHPPELTFQTTRADQSFVGCGELGGPRCGNVARYHEYLFTFSAAIDKYMQMHDFEHILEYLDSQLASKLIR